MNDINKAVKEMVVAEMADYKDSFLRSNGGISVKTNDGIYKRAVDEINLLIKSGVTFPRSVITNALDMFSVANAQKYANANELNASLELLVKLAKGEPLTVLTGEDSEWVKSSNKLVNVRFNSIIKVNDVPYYTKGYSFLNDSGEQAFDGERSWMEIDFPIDVSELVTVEEVKTTPSVDA